MPIDFTKLLNLADDRICKIYRCDGDPGEYEPVGRTKFINILICPSVKTKIMESWHLWDDTIIHAGLEFKRRKFERRHGKQDVWSSVYVYTGTTPDNLMDIMAKGLHELGGTV